MRERVSNAIINTTNVAYRDNEVVACSNIEECPH